MIYADVSTGAQNDLERASEIARAMVMDYGMSRLGRVTYRESNSSPFLAGSMPELGRSRGHSEQTAREIDEEVNRIMNAAIDRVRRTLETRRVALEAITARLIESEVIDGGELASVIDASTGSPQLVPGTSAEPRKTEQHPAASPSAADRPPPPSLSQPS
jgi:cell division protease FtsH